MKHKTEPRVYVGTYAKYNSGSIEGKWLDLSDYSDRDEFYAACQELHGPGEHEFMFQDHEGIPERFIGESHISENLWTDWIELDDDDKELLEVYLENIDSDGTLEQAKEAFDGKFSSAKDWAESTLDDQGYFKNVADQFKNYFDYEAYARDCRLGGDMNFVDHDGEVWAFRNI